MKKIFFIQEQDSQGMFSSFGESVSYRFAKEGKANILLLNYSAVVNDPGRDGRKSWHKTKKIYVPKNVIIIHKSHSDSCGIQRTYYKVQTFRNGKKTSEEEVVVGDYIFNYPTPWPGYDDLTEEQSAEWDEVSEAEDAANNRASEIEKIISEGEEIKF